MFLDDLSILYIEMKLIIATCHFNFYYFKLIAAALALNKTTFSKQKLQTAPD
jgi:hypothetical protein